MPGFRLRGHSIDMAKARLKLGKSSDEFTAISDETDESKKVGQPAAVKRVQWWHRLNGRQKIILSMASVVLMTGVLSGIFIFFPHRHSTAPVHNASLTVKAVDPPKPTTVASPLTGVQVQPELAARPVTAIMIENSLDARPQSGLQDAGVVFEAIAEGGITRFMALFQEAQPNYVGPVRSLRPYYLDFAQTFQASIAHVGGSPDALAQVRSGPRDIDQFFNAGAYWRVSSRYAPHNVYTAFDRLDGLNKQKGYTSSQFTSWKRKEEKKLATPTAAHIDVNMSGPLYSSHYDYDPTTNSYMRSEGGKPHIAISAEADKAGQQLHPKVVLTLAMTYSVIDGAGHSSYGTTGSGAMYVFQDGGVTAGTWSKADRNSQFEFKDAAGKPIVLNTGQVWVSIVSSIGAVKSAP
jgi:hypothetical protein